MTSRGNGRTGEVEKETRMEVKMEGTARTGTGGLFVLLFLPV